MWLVLGFGMIVVGVFNIALSKELHRRLCTDRGCKTPFQRTVFLVRLFEGSVSSVD